MSMRLVPKSDFQSEVNSTSFADTAAASVPTLPDTLREGQGPLSVASQVNGRHPLEARLKHWDATQHQLKLETYRRIFGSAEPVKRTMELEIVEKTDFKPVALSDGGCGNVHRDILLGKDASVEWEDVYTGFDEQAPKDFHSEMERKVGI